MIDKRKYIAFQNGKRVDSSMPLQKSMNVLGQFRADSLRRGDLFHTRFPQPIDGPELAQQQILPVLAHARAIVENAFADPLLHQELVVGVGETVGFVANALEQTQRAGIRRQDAAASARPGR